MGQLFFCPAASDPLFDEGTEQPEKSHISVSAQSAARELPESGSGFMVQEVLYRPSTRQTEGPCRAEGGNGFG